MAGGVPVYVPLRRRPRSADGGRIGVDASDAWSLDLDELRAAITPKTRVLVLNTPHNPSGKVFSRNELLGIAEVAREHNLVVLSDEVVRRERVGPGVLRATAQGELISMIARTRHSMTA